MNHRKRQQESLPSAPGKRARSTLPVKRKSAWGIASAALLAEERSELARLSDEGQTDHGLEEAIAALLEIGGDKSQAPVKPDRPPRKAEQKADPSNIQSIIQEQQPAGGQFVNGQASLFKQVTSGTLPEGDRLPTTSSASDESTTAAVVLPIRGGGGRSSIDSASHLSGTGAQQRILRQGSVQLLPKEPLEVRVSCPSAQQQRQDSGTLPSTVPRLVIRIEETQPVAPPMLHPSMAANPLKAAAKGVFRSKGNVAAIIGPKTGCNVVSTGVPPSAMPMAEVTASSRLGLSAMQDPEPLTRLDPDQSSSPLATQSFASFHGGKLIVIAAPAPGPKKDPHDRPALDAQPSGRITTLPSRSSRESTQTSLARKPTSAASKTAGEKPVWQSVAAPKTAAACPGGTSSGDDSSDEMYQPNWGLDLFSALNPSVITTGHCNFKE